MICIVMVDDLAVIVIYSRIDIHVIMLLNNNRISLRINSSLLRCSIIVILLQILKVSLYLIHLVHQIYLVVNFVLS